jgi:tetratricopeptide (TPR) repeat protein
MKRFGKIFAAFVLLIGAVAGLTYGSLMRGMDRAAEEYKKGDPQGALQRYEQVEQSLRSMGTFTVMPAKDRRNLLLNQARLLYAMGRYDDARERVDRVTEISGGSNNDARFLLLKGEITFRKAMTNYRESSKPDPRVLDDALHSAEDMFRESLRLDPTDWDAKYNFEYISYVRNLMNQSSQGKIKILMENVRVEQQRPQELPADLSP